MSGRHIWPFQSAADLQEEERAARDPAFAAELAAKVAAARPRTAPPAARARDSSGDHHR